MKKLFLSILTLCVTTAQPAHAQLSGYGTMFVNPGYNENQDKSYLCFKKLGYFYQSLGVVYAVPQTSEGRYWGTSYDLSNATEASRSLKGKYQEAKSYCKGLEAYLPAQVVDGYLRGFNFETGEFSR